jgi:hypothetical protein
VHKHTAQSVAIHKVNPRYAQVFDFWLRLVWTVGSCIVSLDAPILTTSKPARTALTWMLLVALVAMFFSITFADLTWWLWGAMLMWTGKLSGFRRSHVHIRPLHCT